MGLPLGSGDRVDEVARYVLAHPWKVFVEGWNWKTALLSAFFRGVAFALPIAGLAGSGAVRSVCIELGFRAVIGGFWGSLLQVFRRAQPAWLVGLSVTVVLPAAAHALEFAALRASDAAHIKTGMIVSIVISIGSLLINLGLMRRGVLVTGNDGAPFTYDLRRIPGELAAIFRCRAMECVK